MSKIRGKLTYANVMSTIAVFVTLGGATAFAATQLAKNSVGTKQLKKNAVTSAKVKNNSLRAADFQAGQLPAGPRGAEGPRGPKGDPGPEGPAGPFPDPLASGQTLRGVFYLEGPGGPVGGSISFGFRLASAPTANVLAPGAASTATCPGSATDPSAVPGHLCLYETETFNVGFFSVCSPSAGCGLATREGAKLLAGAAAPGEVTVGGEWAVTAP